MTASLVSPEECDSLKKDRSVRHIDVRTPQEFNDGHPCASVNVPWMIDGPDGRSRNPEFLSTMQKEFPTVDEELIISCKSGGRSAQASSCLTEAGYSKLYDMEGGWLKYAANKTLGQE